MKTKDQVTSDKLRGGFYSPEPLVDLCFRRAAQLLEGRAHLRVLEPSSGDGAFLSRLGASNIAEQIESVEAIEIDPKEAEKSRAALHDSGLPGNVHACNVLDWNLENSNLFDLVVGNPPYVRFQFVSDVDRRRAVNIGTKLGIPGSAVSNLWIPVLLLSLDRLREGGVFSLILPTEFLTGVSAGRVRRWLLRSTSDLHVDLFAPRSFPDVLQEVAVLTGRRVGPQAVPDSTVKITDHNGEVRTWQHLICENAKTWTSYLLPPSHHSAVVDAFTLPDVVKLGQVAKFSVSTVTGANGFFSVNTDLVDEYKLEPWAIPLLPRARYAPGLVFSEEEHANLTRTSVPSWLLDFAAEKPSPLKENEPGNYIAHGEKQNLHMRYKTRIRTPWYRVPVVPPADLLMAKRSNRFPRVLVNDAKVITTDTIYRGQVLPDSLLEPQDIAATFHNSLTLLSAEIEGRSFGGGVLELVPSEIASLSLPVVSGAKESISDLDYVARNSSSDDALVEATDARLLEWLPDLDLKQLELIQEARDILVRRRIERT